MTLVLLIRHGRTTANSSGILAGWTKGVRLDERGEQQAGELAKRLAEVPLAAVVSSPLERCRQTSDIVLSGREGVARHLDERIGECRYGDWTGRPLAELAKEPLWKVVQGHPSAARFPGPEGESMADMSARAVAAVREWNTLISGRTRTGGGVGAVLARRRHQGASPPTPSGCTWTSSSGSPAIRAR